MLCVYLCMRVCFLCFLSVFFPLCAILYLPVCSLKKQRERRHGAGGAKTCGGTGRVWMGNHERSV